MLGSIIAGLLVVIAQAAPPHVLLRVPAGSPMPPELPGLFAQWLGSGQVSNALLLTEGQAEKNGQIPGFEAMGILKFPDEAAYQAWQKAASPSLPRGLIVRRAEVLTHDEISPADRRHTAFVVNAYTPKVSRERYREFAVEYLAPLYAAQQATKLLVSSTMYLEEGAVGQTQALAVLEYRDREALTEIVPLKLKIREKLNATNPGYARFHPIKDELRSDDGGTFAKYTELPDSLRAVR